MNPIIFSIFLKALGFLGTLTILSLVMAWVFQLNFIEFNLQNSSFSFLNLDVLTILTAVASIVGAAVLMLSFLKTNRDNVKANHLNRAEFNRQSKEELSDTGNKKNNINSYVLNMLKTNASSDAKTKDYKNLVDFLTKKIKEEAKNGVIQELLTEINSDNKAKSKYDSLFSDIHNIIFRLNSAINSSTNKGNLSLVIGIITSGLAMLILFSSLNSKISLSPDGDQLTRFLLTNLPNMALAFFIQLLSFFFLKLYKASLDEIKYYQNELTNLESKFIAFKLSIVQGDDAMIKATIAKLMDTERNFILEKSQTTIELEKNRLSASETTEFVSIVKDLIKNKE